MFRLSRPLSVAGRRVPLRGPSVPSPLRRAALFGGGLVCLWGALQLAPLPAEPPAEAPPAEDAASFPAIAPAVEAPVETPAPDAPAEATAPATEATAPTGPVEAAAPLPAPPPVPAPAATAHATPGAERLPERQGGLFRFGNVVAFLLLAGGGAFAVVLHRKKRGARPPAGAAPAMGVLGELSLGPGQAVRLVRVHDEVLVLGVAQAGVTLLHRYPYEALLTAAPAAPAAAAPAEPAATGHARLFADVLRQYIPASAHA